MYGDPQPPVAPGDDVVLMDTPCRGGDQDEAMGVIMEGTGTCVAASGPCGDAALIGAAVDDDEAEEKLGEGSKDVQQPRLQGRAAVGTDGGGQQPRLQGRAAVGLKAANLGVPAGLLAWGCVSRGSQDPASSHVERKKA